MEQYYFLVRTAGQLTLPGYHINGISVAGTKGHYSLTWLLGAPEKVQKRFGPFDTVADAISNAELIIPSLLEGHYRTSGINVAEIRAVTYTQYLALHTERMKLNLEPVNGGH